jgi:glycosyltransferase involved in cell wall biosynthesis
MLTIITPVLNGARFIQRNILSVASLKIKHEHIVVDGGSTDGTLGILKQYLFVKVIVQKEASGMYGAINEGIAVSSGELISYVNADDLVVPRYFEKLCKRIEAGYDVAYGDAFFRYQDTGKLVLRSGIPWASKFLPHGYFPFVQSSSVYARQAVNAIGGFDTRYRIIGDLDFFTKLAVSGCSFSYVPGVASVFLKYGGSLGDTNKERYLQELAQWGVHRNLNHRIVFSILLRFMNIRNSMCGIYRKGRTAVVELDNQHG